MLIYGLDGLTSQCRHIRDVKNGLGCGCICPVCHTPLVAQQGFIRDWHFRHYSEQECSYALETMLHLRAKEIFMSAKAIFLPYLAVCEQATLLDSGDLLESSTSVLVDYSEKINLDDLKLIEHSLGNIKPDVIVYACGEPILIEIAVTHFISNEKRRKIEEKNISCIEIDMSSFRNIELTDNEFSNILVESIEHKDWVFHKEECATSISKKRELASLYGGKIQYVNKGPDGIKYGYDYSEITNQIGLI